MPEQNEPQAGGPEIPAGVRSGQAAKQVAELQGRLRSQLVDNQIESAFTYHAPKADQPVRYLEIRSTAKEFARLIVERTPASREQSLALTRLEEAVFWANAAVARNE